ncbi:MAG: hypothetical protein E7156_00180 [Streptococcus gallolyticus]|uniref:Uncharacterized protein n=1 Tax=Streptococcus gallolyticus TaxID=315405 RepID=A0A927XG44_9STRE|nr:hypothetical protein [Streptococcus gallolyticus]
MTLSNLWSYLVENFINWIIFAYAAYNLVMGIKKGEMGSMIFKLFIAGFAYVFVNGPETVMQQIGNIAQKVLGG